VAQAATLSLNLDTAGRVRTDRFSIYTSALLKFYFLSLFLKAIASHHQWQN